MPSLRARQIPAQEGNGSKLDHRQRHVPPRFRRTQRRAQISSDLQGFLIPLWVPENMAAKFRKLWPVSGRRRRGGRGMSERARGGGGETRLGLVVCVISGRPGGPGPGGFGRGGGGERGGGRAAACGGVFSGVEREAERFGRLVFPGRGICFPATRRCAALRSVLQGAGGAGTGALAHACQRLGILLLFAMLGAVVSAGCGSWSWDVVRAGVQAEGARHGGVCVEGVRGTGMAPELLPRISGRRSAPPFDPWEKLRSETGESPPLDETQLHDRGVVAE